VTTEHWPISNKLDVAMTDLMFRRRPILSDEGNAETTYSKLSGWNALVMSFMKRLGRWLWPNPLAPWKSGFGTEKQAIGLLIFSGRRKLLFCPERQFDDMGAIAFDNCPV
jgi:hypothetical protein